MKVNKKIKQLLKGKQYSVYHLHPHDIITITNYSNSPYDIYVEKKEFNFFGKALNKIINYVFNHNQNENQ